MWGNEGLERENGVYPRARESQGQKQDSESDMSSLNTCVTQLQVFNSEAGGVHWGVICVGPGGDMAQLCPWELERHLPTGISAWGSQVQEHTQPPTGIHYDEHILPNSTLTFRGRGGIITKNHN